MEIIIKAGQLILSLSILVVLHELGHFIPAKLFKTKVEKFYLFFDPWFSLFKIKRGETEYGVGWLPLGGYVKIAGMVDESMDVKQLESEAKPWEFRAKPAWQRLIIMLGGVTVNVLLAIFLFAMIHFVWGQKYLPIKNMNHGIMVDSLGYQMGLRNGDHLLTLEGMPLERFEPGQILTEVIVNGASKLQVKRDGKVENIEVSKDFTKYALDIKRKSGFIYARLPFQVAAFAPKSPAKQAGIKKDDYIVSCNGQSMPYFDQFKIFIQNQIGKKIKIGLMRNGLTDTTYVELQVPPSGLIGVMPHGTAKFYTFETQEFGFFESFPVGLSKAYSTLSDYVKQFKLIFDPEMEGYKHVGGFMTIGSIFSPEWNWQEFWNITAFLSIMLAFMNILPIPALDGGHAMFTLYEMISGRKPSEQFLRYAQAVGMILLFSLLILANGNDLIKYLFN